MERCILYEFVCCLMRHYFVQEQPPGKANKLVKAKSQHNTTKTGKAPAHDYGVCQILEDRPASLVLCPINAESRALSWD